MATYAKILKDPEGNQILPYTRSKLVYMDDGSTVQDAVTRPATNAQMGRVLIGNNLGYDGNGTISLSKFGVCNALGYTPVKPTDYADNSKYGVVKVGNNILEEDGVISVDDRCIKEALGYTPAVNESLIQENTFAELKNNNGKITGDLARIDANKQTIDYLSGYIKITRIHAKIWFVYVNFSSSTDIIAYKGINNSLLGFFTITMGGIDQSFNSATGPSERMVFPVIANNQYQKFGNDGLVGQIYIQSNNGGHQSTIVFGMDKTIPANTYITTNFYLYDFTYAKS